MITWKRSLALLIILITGCNSVDQTESPDVEIPQENLNSYIHLVAMDAINSFKTNEPIFITIEGISEETLAFPANYGIRIFLKEDNIYTELENITMYDANSVNYLIPLNGKSANSVTTSLLPRLPDITKRAQIRVFIIGNVVEDSKATDQQVGAFIDLPLTPP